VNDLKNKEVRKGIARHANEDFFEVLIHKTSFLLSNYGAVWLILPIKQAIEVVACASNYGLSLNHRINIYSDKNKSSFRQIICLAKEDKAFVETDFFIYESLGNHTLEYKQLLKDFFLAF